MFGYERIDAVREIARNRANRGDNEIEKLGIRIDHAEAAKLRLDERRTELADAHHRLAALDAARPLFEELTARITEAGRVREQAGKRLQQLERRSGELPDQARGEQVLATAASARARLAEAERDLELAGDRLAEAEADVASDRFRDVERRAEKAAERVRECESRRDVLETRLDGLRRRAGELPDRIKGIQVVAAAELAWALRVEAAEEAQAASARLADAELAVASDRFKQRENSLDRASDILVRLVSIQDAADRAAEAAARARTAVEAEQGAEVRAGSARAAAVRDLERAEAAAQGAASRLEHAERRLEDARHADMAGSLREQLAGGDTCPVCEQPVHRVPPGIGGDTAAAQAAVERRRSEREHSESRLRRALGVAETTKAQLAATERRLAEARLRLIEAREEEERQTARADACRDELAGLLGEGDPQARVNEERAALDATRAALDAARSERDAKRAVLDGAREEERRAQEAVSNLRARIGASAALLQKDFDLAEGDPGAVRAALASLHTEWNRTTTRLESDLIGERAELEAASVRLAECRAEMDAFRAAVDEARWVRDRERTVRDGAAKAERRAQASVSNLRTRIGALAVVLDEDSDLPEADPGAVRAALTSLHREWKRAASDLARTIEQQITIIERASVRLEEERTRHGVEASIEAALAEVRARREGIGRDIEREEKLVAGVVELLRERREWRRRVTLNRRLVRDLTDARFIRFLLDEERATLAGLGSEHLERLSSGRYRFTDEGDFHVVDLNSAEAVRRPDSLSGGETFLASLALALGLAEMVGRRGGRLDAFFLDEGFGTLDPQHLDLAMDGVESLVADREQRLVVVVSHVPELRDRIEDLITLDKDPLTGDSIVASGGTP